MSTENLTPWRLRITYWSTGAQLQVISGVQGFTLVRGENEITRSAEDYDRYEVKDHCDFMARMYIKMMKGLGAPEPGPTEYVNLDEARKKIMQEVGDEEGSKAQ